MYAVLRVSPSVQSLNEDGPLWYVICSLGILSHLSSCCPTFEVQKVGRPGCRSIYGNVIGRAWGRSSELGTSPPTEVRVATQV